MAERFIDEHPEETVAILSKATRLPPEVARAAMARHRYRMRLDADIVGSLQRISDFLHEQRKIDRVPDIAAVGDESLLKTNSWKKQPQ